MSLKVVATPIGGGQAFVLCDGTNARGAGSRMAIDVDDASLLAFTFDGVVQPKMPLGGTEVEYIDRELESGSMPLRVEYEFSSGAEMFAFVKSLQTKIPRKGDLLITFRGTTTTIPNVWLRPFQVRFIGEVSCRVEFNFRFGLMS